jgi:tryptophan 2,3-dioxygenase
LKRAEKRIVTFVTLQLFNAVTLAHAHAFGASARVMLSDICVVLQAMPATEQYQPEAKSEARQKLPAVLETMMPVDFLAFRDHLMPASGFQSFQFRELEYVSGLKEPRFLRNYEAGSEEHERLSLRLSGQSLPDAFYAMLRREGFDLPDIPAEGNGAKQEAEQKRIGELKRIYQDAERHYPLFLLAESLIEYDEMFSMWRLRHIKMVERMIGSKTGTGGSEGAAYLKKTVERQFFPELWELRSYLSKKSSGE